MERSNDVETFLKVRDERRVLYRKLWKLCRLINGNFITAENSDQFVEDLAEGRTGEEFEKTVGGLRQNVSQLRALLPQLPE